VLNIELKLLPDGTGRIRIHWLVRDPVGKIAIQSRVIETSWGPKVMEGQRWRMACQPHLASIAPQQQGDKTVPYPCSDDPRAVTCPECMKTEEFEKARQELEELVPVNGAGGVPSPQVS
jgi:hypothetical protein